MHNEGFIYGDMVKIMNALGHPVGSSFDLTLIDGNCICLNLEQEHIKWTSNYNVPQALMCNVTVLWLLAFHGDKNDLGKFSCPIPKEELLEVGKFVKVWQQRDYFTLPVEQLVPRLQNDMSAFWSNFVAGGRVR